MTHTIPGSAIKEESRPVLERAIPEMRENDVVYISRFASFAWGYYARRAELKGVRVIYAPDLPEHEVDEFATELLGRVARNDRVFLFMTHYYPDSDTRMKVVQALEARGTRVVASFEAQAASVTQLDLSAVESVTK